MLICSVDPGSDGPFLVQTINSYEAAGKHIVWLRRGHA